MNKTNILIRDKEILESLYVTDRKTTREIGAIYNVSKHTVENALEIIGVERRKTRTNGTKPTKEFIEKAILVDLRSLADIAKELGCDPGAVKFWAKEYGISIPKMGTWDQRNFQRGYTRPSKTELESLYTAGNSLQNIAEFFNCTRQQISDAFKSYEIETRQSGWGHKYFICKDGHKVKSTYEKRVDDWLYENGVEHTYEPALPFSNLGHSDFFCNGTYIEIFGVWHSEKYTERKKYKVEQYEKSNSPVIFINHWDFHKRNNDLWIRKLSHLRASNTSSKNLSACLSQAPARKC